jgi:hypothetical protein
VTNKPKLEDIQGTYQITQQNITTNGLAVLQGRVCLLDLRPDGSFTLTNYPTPPFTIGFISNTGRWHFDTLGSFGKNQELWGIRFSNATFSMEPLALRLQGTPYNLMLTYGDPDDGTVMTFGKTNETTGLKNH